MSHGERLNQNQREKTMPRKRNYRIGELSQFTQLELLVRKCDECGAHHRIEEGYLSHDHSQFLCIVCSIREDDRRGNHALLSHE